MNIICYINKLNDGGAERAMSVVANGLAQLGHRVSMVTDYSAETEYPLNASVERLVLDGEFTGVTSKGRAQRTLRRISNLRNICKAQEADVVLSFMRESNFRAILATCFLKTKNLISVRIDPKIGYRNKVVAMLAKLLYPMANGCVFQTQEAQAWFSNKIQRKSRVIFNPVSEAFYSVQGTPGRDKRVVSCGRLSKQKRFDLLIDAFDKVADDFPEYTLEVYGVGELQERLQAQIEELRRTDRIRLMGRCEDVPNAIKDASLFVLSSDFEGLPNALMEAMALGLPVISTDCGGGGARALIDNGVDGQIVPCGDADALASAIGASLNAPVEMARRGENARRKGQTFATEYVVADWEAYIRQICQE